MRLNSMLATVLIFLCSLVISSCSNDELAPISLKNRETANIKLNYPNNQTYSFPLQGGVYLANLHTSFLCNLIYPTFSRILLYSC